MSVLMTNITSHISARFDRYCSRHRHRSHRSHGRLFVLLALLSLTSFSHAYTLEKVKGDVYRFIDDRHRSVVLVTSEGILVTDPMNHKSAEWLKQTLHKRFGDLPIKYVVFSHNHSDHIYGASVFESQTTRFVAHDLAKQDIIVTRANTVTPDISFSQRMDIALGDHIVELRYHGPNDGRGSISMLFKKEKLLFVVDWIVIGRMPWQKLWSYDIQGMINSTQQVLDLDFDTFVGGHADIGDKADVRRYLNYLNDLYAAVIDGIHAGKSLDQLKADTRLDDYKDFKNYEAWLPLNIEGVHERLMEESGMGWRPDL